MNPFILILLIFGYPFFSLANSPKDSPFTGLTVNFSEYIYFNKEKNDHFFFYYCKLGNCNVLGSKKGYSLPMMLRIHNEVLDPNREKYHQTTIQLIIDTSTNQMFRTGKSSPNIDQGLIVLPNKGQGRFGYLNTSIPSVLKTAKKRKGNDLKAYNYKIVKGWYWGGTEGENFPITKISEELHTILNTKILSKE